MTKREMTSLLIKLMGIYALVQFVPVFAQSFGTLLYKQFIELLSGSYFDSLMTLLTSSVLQLLWIGVCVWVICKSDFLASRLYPEDSPVGQLITLGYYEVQLLGFQFIGLLSLIAGLRRLIEMFGYYSMLSSDIYSEAIPELQGSLDKMLWLEIMKIGFQLAIGLCLFLYPQGLANLWALVQGKSKPYAEKDRTEG